MKKFMFVVVCAFAMTFAACGNKTTEAEVANDTTVVDTVQVDTLAVDTTVAE